MPKSRQFMSVGKQFVLTVNPNGQVVSENIYTGVTDGYPSLNAFTIRYHFNAPSAVPDKTYVPVTSLGGQIVYKRVEYNTFEAYHARGGFRMPHMDYRPYDKV